MGESFHPGRVLRESLGLSIPDFAKSIDRSRPYVAQTEEGRHPYGRKTALRIADLYSERMEQLGITVEDLLRGKDCDAPGDPSAPREAKSA